MIACPFITAGHPFERAMDQVRKVLETRRDPAPPGAASTRIVRQHELKGVRDAGGAWRMDRFYSSTLSWDAPGTLPFDAVTYLYSSATGTGEWFRFPRDPYLGALAQLGEAEILQYVVLRRLTYRAKTAEGATYIGKCKRRSVARGSFDLLALVSAAAERHHPPVRVPAPLGHDHSRNLFEQEELSGRPVSDLVNDRTLEMLLYGVGRVHAALHALRVPGLPATDERARIDSLSRECDWISFFRPAESGRLAAIRRVLVETAPRLAEALPVTCHGDFVCSHVLHGPDGFGVVDFDLAKRGDPHGDAALLLSSLTHDVPFLHRAWRDAERAPEALLERAVGAYVDGYQSRGRNVLDRRRLLWHRIAAEIHILGLMFTKDRFHALAFERGMGLIDRLTGELSRAGEGGA